MFCTEVLLREGAGEFLRLARIHRVDVQVDGLGFAPSPRKPALLKAEAACRPQWEHTTKPGGCDRQVSRLIYPCGQHCVLTSFELLHRDRCGMIVVGHTGPKPKLESLPSLPFAKGHTPAQPQRTAFVLSGRSGNRTQQQAALTAFYSYKAAERHRSPLPMSSSSKFQSCSGRGRQPRGNNS